MKSEVRQSVGWAVLLCGLLTASCSPNPQSGESSQSQVLGSNQSAVAQDGSEFSGMWISNKKFQENIYHDMVRIEKNGSSFILRFSSDGGQLTGMRGVFPATYQSGILHTGHPVIGDIAFSPADNAIFIMGARFNKTSEEVEAKRVSDAQAAMEAQRQAELAQREAQAAESDRRIAEASRLDSIGVHVYNCYFNLVQCAEAAEDARNYPADADAKLRSHRGNPENPPWDTAVQARARANHTTPAGLNSMDETRARVARQSSGRKGDSLDAEGAADAAERAAGAAEKMQKF